MLSRYSVTWGRDLSKCVTNCFVRLSHAVRFEQVVAGASQSTGEAGETAYGVLPGTVSGHLAARVRPSCLGSSGLLAR